MRKTEQQGGGTECIRLRVCVAMECPVYFAVVEHGARGREVERCGGRVTQKGPGAPHISQPRYHSRGSPGPQLVLCPTAGWRGLAPRGVGEGRRGLHGRATRAAPAETLYTPGLRRGLRLARAEPMKTRLHKGRKTVSAVREVVEVHYHRRHNQLVDEGETISYGEGPLGLQEWGRAWTRGAGGLRRPRCQATGPPVPCGGAP